MKRALSLGAVLAVALATATDATAAVFIRLTTTAVHRGGVLNLVGNADHMPLYALPRARLSCARRDTCPGPIHRAARPKRPFVFLGYTPTAPSESTPTQWFSVPLPRALRPGRYKVFVWCQTCGGSLIIAGSNSSGQTLRVLP